MNELPAGWAHATLSELCKQPEQRVPLADEMFTYIDIASVDRELKTVSEPQRLLGADAPSRARKLVERGDVIVSMTRPNLNAVALIDEQYNDCIASTGFDVLKPIEVEPRWIFSAVRSARFVDAMCEKVQGALYPAVKSADIREFEIPLPPLAEQTRIAQKLDELLAQVDTLKARINAIPALLKRFRQSVLAAAVSGRLTEEWRVQNVVLADEVTFPEGQCEPIWPQSSLQSLISGIEQGWSPKCESEPVAETEEAWAVIKTTSIQPIDFYPTENKRLPANLSPRPELSVKAGDLLITRAGPRSRAAVCCYVKKTQPHLMICDKAYRFRPHANVMEGRLLCLFLNSPQYISLLDDLKTGISESGMNLTMRKFQELQIPHPPLVEQTEIVRRVEQLFAFADQLEAKVASAKSRIDHLTQSILAKAFRGELVPQDPSDEPASVLLERIKAQRAAAPKAKRGRKASA